jgi:hypothetical protein
MKRLFGVMLLMLGLVVVAVAIASLSSHPAAAASKPPALPPISVSVANTPNVNANITNASLPVTGSVSAAVSGTVNANIINASIPVTGTLSATLAPGASVTVANPSLAVTNPPGTTHMSQDVNNLITLWSGYAPNSTVFPSSTCTGGLEQVTPAGTPSQSCYTVPPGMLLVVTDIQFTTYSASGSGSGDAALVLDGGYHYYNQKAYDGNGIVTLHDYFTTGMVFNHSPTFQVDVLGQFVFYNLTLQGYLVSSN